MVGGDGACARPLTPPYNPGQGNEKTNDNSKNNSTDVNLKKNERE